jgi:hypothetical protein
MTVVPGGAAADSTGADHAGAHPAPSSASNDKAPAITADRQGPARCTGAAVHPTTATSLSSHVLMQMMSARLQPR